MIVDGLSELVPRLSFMTMYRPLIGKRGTVNRKCNVSSELRKLVSRLSGETWVRHRGPSQ